MPQKDTRDMSRNPQTENKALDTASQPGVGYKGKDGQNKVDVMDKEEGAFPQPTPEDHTLRETAPTLSSIAEELRRRGVDLSDDWCDGMFA